MTMITGIKSLRMMSEAIKNGENVDTKHRTQFGSNELTDAMLPVPKNDTKTYKICTFLKKLRKINDWTECSGKRNSSKISFFFS